MRRVSRALRRSSSSRREEALEAEKKAVRAKIAELEKKEGEVVAKELEDAIASGKDRLVAGILSSDGLRNSLLRLKVLPDAGPDNGENDEEELLEPEPEGVVAKKVKGKWFESSKDAESEKKDVVQEGEFHVRVNEVLSVPMLQDFFERHNFMKSGYFVQVAVEGSEDREEIKRTTKTRYSEGGNMKYNEEMSLGTVKPTDLLRFRLYIKYFESKMADGIRVAIGEFRVTVADLLREAVLTQGQYDASACMWLSDPESDVFLFDSDYVDPCRLVVGVNTKTLPKASFPAPLAEKEVDAEVKTRRSFAKHVFVCTRGTRGDVQPFIALARGLAEQHNFLVTICTEDRYRHLVERYSQVKKGAIMFRPSGGDTEKRISTALAKWAFRQRSTALQFAMLGHSEREFFDSEPAFHYWCQLLRPDVILFGFPVANLAMVLSESLGIPLIGLFLQPTVIPSKHYAAVSPIEKEADIDLSHRIYGRIKMFMENNPLDFGSMLNVIRARRDLEPYSHRVNNYEMLVEQNIPLIVPINERTFGGKPSDWHENACLTDFIFLRTGAVPNLKPRFVKMIMEAKAVREPLVVMAFSSMPVPRSDILKLAMKMIEKSRHNPRVIALVGSQNIVRKDEHATDQSVEDSAQIYVKNGKLLVDAGAPFGKLFPQVDCVIAHGGLGTTAEILRAGKPCITTGVLILDQRYWGRRVHELGCAPQPCHVRDLEEKIISYLDDCLSRDSELPKNAKLVQEQLLEGCEDDDIENDGVEINVKAFLELLQKTKGVRSHHESIMRSPQRLATAMAEDTNRALRQDIGRVRSLAIRNLREVQKRWGYAQE